MKIMIGDHKRAHKKAFLNRKIFFLTIKYSLKNEKQDEIKYE